jgi:RNA polymerase sigma-B factor
MSGASAEALLLKTPRACRARADSLPIPPSRGSGFVPERRHDEQRLFRAYRDGRRDRAVRDALVERYLPLARSLARRYARGGEPLEDLEQVASLALIKAIDAFDPDRGTAFSSYAVPSIVGALKRHYRDIGWAVRPPRRLQELALEVRRSYDELSSANGSPPTAAQVAAYADVSVEDVLEARTVYSALHADSLDRPRPSGDDGDTGTLIDTIGARDGEIRRAFDRVALETLLDTLDARERTIVKLYYQEELTQAQIGRRLGYSQMHISRLLHHAVEELLLAASRDERQPRSRSAA